MLHVFGCLRGTLFDAVHGLFLAQKGSLLHAFGHPFLTQFTIYFWPRRVPCYRLSGAFGALLLDAVYHLFLAQKELVEKPVPHKPTRRTETNGCVRKPTETNRNQRKPMGTNGNQLILSKNCSLGEGKGRGTLPRS